MSVQRTRSVRSTSGISRRCATNLLMLGILGCEDAMPEERSVALASRGHALAQARDPVPRGEVSKLMNEGILHAMRVLRARGDFDPFAFVMTDKGRTLCIESRPNDENRDMDSMLELVRSELQEGVAERGYKAIAIFSKAVLKHPEDPDKPVAMHIGLEHRFGFCASVFVPYAVEGPQRVTLGEQLTARREAEVFPRCN